MDLSDCVSLRNVVTADLYEAAEIGRMNMRQMGASPLFTVVEGVVSKIDGLLRVGIIWCLYNPATIKWPHRNGDMIVVYPEGFRVSMLLHVAQHGP